MSNPFPRRQALLAEPTPGPIVGTSLDDALVGTASSDVVLGLSGDDRLEGGRGGDVLDGGSGIDTALYVNSNGAVTIDLSLGSASGGEAAGDSFFAIENLVGSRLNDVLVGNDEVNVIEGGRGNDTIAGGVGDDVLTGNEGNDKIAGGQGSDRLFGSDGNDSLDGGTGDDELHGGANNDTMTGGGGNDYMEGDDGVDRMKGGADNDLMYGGAGNDTLEGEAGDDYLVGGAGADRIDGGADTDTASYWDADSGVVADLGRGRGFGGDAQGDRYAGIEWLDGSQSADTLIGDGNSNRLFGDYGDDVLNGLGGDDVLIGDDGLFPQAASTPFALPSATDFSDDGDFGTETWQTNILVNDLLSGGAGADLLIGGSGPDAFFMSFDGVWGAGSAIDSPFGAIVLESRAASWDVMLGGEGNDVLIGGGAAEVFRLFDPVSPLPAPSGPVMETYDPEMRFSGIEYFYLGAGNDVFDFADAPQAYDVNISVYAGAGNDVVLAPETARNWLWGEGGDDRLAGSIGDDRIDGGAGIDTAAGGAGADVFVFADYADLGDAIVDFAMGEGDVLDFAALFGPGTVNAANVNQFVSIAEVGGNSVVSIDADGLGSASSVAAVTLQGVTGLDPLDMLNQGNLNVG